MNEEKPIKLLFRKLWNRIDGWKTIIGLVGHSILLASNIKFEYASFNQQVIGHSLIFQITGVGIGDKVRKFSKTDTGKKAINIFGKLIRKK